MQWKHYAQIFHHHVEVYRDRVAIRFEDLGEGKEITWQSFGEQVKAVSMALVDSGIREGEPVGIFSRNCPEWSIADIATLNIRAIPTAVNASEPIRQLEYIVNETELRLIFVGDQEEHDKALSILDNSQYLKKIIVFNRRTKIEKRPEVIYFSDLLKAGRESKAEEELKERSTRFSQEDIATLIYISSPNGEPRGVMLTHSNILFQLELHHQYLFFRTKEKDLSLCFLPLSHVFERMWTYFVFYLGITNYYLENPRDIIKVMRKTKPTVICAVPRFYEKIYEMVYKDLASQAKYKKKLFHWAVKRGFGHHLRLMNGGYAKEPLLLKWHYKLADLLVLKKIREITGGNIRFWACGGASLPVEVARFFFSLGQFITYGYGLTETAATVTFPTFSSVKLGSVGKPMAGLEVETDPINSEVLVRGQNVMKGYYKKPDLTARAFTRDGFFRTGDIGRFDQEGNLYITDRLKELLKTSGGKYISPRRLEAIIGADRFISQIVVIGEGYKFVSALVVPNFSTLEEYAWENHIRFTSRQELILSPEVIEFYRQRLIMASKNLADYEKVKKFKLIAEKITIEAERNTQTMEMKRQVIDTKYREVIKSFYGDYA